MFLPPLRSVPISSRFVLVCCKLILASRLFDSFDSFDSSDSLIHSQKSDGILFPNIFPFISSSPCVFQTIGQEIVDEQSSWWEMVKTGRETDDRKITRESKTAVLLDLLDNVLTPKLFNEENMNLVFQMVESILFRPLSPMLCEMGKVNITRENSLRELNISNNSISRYDSNHSIVVVSFDNLNAKQIDANHSVYDDEDQPEIDPAWSDIEPVYDFFLKYLVYGNQNVEMLIKFIDEKFIANLIDHFATPDAREARLLKTIVHDIYGSLFIFILFLLQCASSISDPS